MCRPFDSCPNLLCEDQRSKAREILRRKPKGSISWYTDDAQQRSRVLLKLEMTLQFYKIQLVLKLRLLYHFYEC
jgi:hypothetical protein